VRLGPLRRIDDVGWIGRGHQHLREQGIGVQRDGRHHLVDLLATERRGGLLLPQRQPREGDTQERSQYSGEPTNLLQDHGRSSNRHSGGEGYSAGRADSILIAYAHVIPIDDFCRAFQRRKRDARKRH
jgi:hypothetical protein